MRKRYWLVIAFFLGGCGGRTIVPPAIPGLMTIPDTRGCTALTVGEDAAWAAIDRESAFSIRNELVRIDLDSNRVTDVVRNTRKIKRSYFDFDLFDVGGGPDIEIGSTALWVPTPGGDDDEPVVWKVDPSGGEMVGELKFANSAVTRVAIGEHAVWVAGLGKKLLRIDPETAQLSFAIELHTVGLDVAVTDGAVWVLHPDATVSRIDPSTNRVLGAIRLPDSYSTLATTSDAIWLAATPSWLSPWPVLLALWVHDREGLTAVLDREERRGAELARLDPDVNRIVARIRFADDLGPVNVEDVIAGRSSIWVSFTASPPKDSQDSEGRLWLAEIDATTNQLSRTIPLGRFEGSSARLALVENDLLICGSSIWRIPLDAMRASFQPSKNEPAN